MQIIILYTHTNTCFHICILHKYHSTCVHTYTAHIYKAMLYKNTLYMYDTYKIHTSNVYIHIAWFLHVYIYIIQLVYILREYIYIYIYIYKYTYIYIYIYNTHFTSLYCNLTSSKTSRNCWRVWIKCSACIRWQPLLQATERCSQRTPDSIRRLVAL